MGTIAAVARMEEREANSCLGLTIFGRDDFDQVREISKDVLNGDSIVAISSSTSIALERSTECEKEEREVQMGGCLCGQNSKTLLQIAFNIFPFFG